MESLPVGLTLKKKKKKNQSKKNETNNIIVNEIIQNLTTISLFIKTTMKKYNYFPKQIILLIQKMKTYFQKLYFFENISKFVFIFRKFRPKIFRR